jgi:hypothetical protein
MNAGPLLRFCFDRMIRIAEKTILQILLILSERPCAKQIRLKSNYHGAHEMPPLNIRLKLPAFGLRKSTFFCRLPFLHCGTVR